MSIDQLNHDIYVSKQETKIKFLREEIERLQKYEKLVQFIANDYYEMSHDKVKWQHNDWYKRCRKLIEEDNV
jgi:hypothetical protein